MTHPVHVDAERTSSPLSGTVGGGSGLDFVFASSKLDEFENALGNVGTSHKLAPPGGEPHLTGAFQLHALKDLAVFDLRFGCTIDATLAPHDVDDRIAFAMPTRGQTLVHLRTGEFPTSELSGVIIPSGPAAAIRFSEDCETRTLVMNRRRLAEHCAKLLGHDIPDRVEFETSFALAGAEGQSWLRLVNYAAVELKDRNSLSRLLPSAGQQLEQMVMTGFLLAHRHTYSDALLRPQSPAVPFYVRRAEAYIEAHFREPLSLADIAAHAGTSARSLQNGFQSFRHMTPMTFLRKVRLQHAHQALLKADPAFASVTDIAIGCGFGHMGEFAALYKRTYGVSPRETLQRKLRA